MGQLPAPVFSPSVTVVDNAHQPPLSLPRLWPPCPTPSPTPGQLDLLRPSTALLLPAGAACGKISRAALPAPCIPALSILVGLHIVSSSLPPAPDGGAKAQGPALSFPSFLSPSDSLPCAPGDSVSLATALTCVSHGFFPLTVLTVV